MAHIKRAFLEHVIKKGVKESLIVKDGSESDPPYVDVKLDLKITLHTSPIRERTSIFSLLRDIFDPPAIYISIYSTDPEDNEEVFVIEENIQLRVGEDFVILSNPQFIQRYTLT